MAGDPGGHDPFPDIVDVRQAQVFRRGHIAQEVGAGEGGQGAADGGGDVVIAGSDIGDQRPQHIEGSTMADPFLELHVGGNLVVGDVARSFHHDLYALGPGPLGQFAQVQQFLDLGPVGGVRQATGTAAVAQADGHVIFGTDVQDLIVEFVEGVFLPVVEHPAGQEGTTPAHNVHFPAFTDQVVEALAGEAAVHGHEVSPVFGLLFHHGENVVLVHFGHFAMSFDGLYRGLVDGNRTHHDGGMFDDGLPGGIDVVPGGKIHDRIRTGVDGRFQFVQFRSGIRESGRSTDIGVDFGGKAFAHPPGNQVLMVDVGWDADGAFGHSVPDEFGGDSLLAGYFRHLVSDFSLQRSLSLGQHKTYPPSWMQKGPLPWEKESGPTKQPYHFPSAVLTASGSKGRPSGLSAIAPLVMLQL